jgi:hypothetical protein
LACAQTFNWDAVQIEGLVYNGLHAAFLPDTDKARLAADFKAQFDRLRGDLRKAD